MQNYYPTITPKRCTSVNAYLSFLICLNKKLCHIYVTQSPCWLSLLKLCSIDRLSCCSCTIYRFEVHLPNIERFIFVRSIGYEVDAFTIGRPLRNTVIAGVVGQLHETCSISFYSENIKIFLFVD